MEPDTETIRQALVDLERGFWDAAGGDGDYYERHFADDGVMVLPFPGGILTKARTIDSVREAGAWDGFAIDDLRTLAISESTVALLYEGTGRRTGHPGYRALVTSVYRRRGEAWQLVLHQQTPLT